MKAVSFTLWQRREGNRVVEKWVRFLTLRRGGGSLQSERREGERFAGCESCIKAPQQKNAKNSLFGSEPGVFPSGTNCPMILSSIPHLTCLPLAHHTLHLVVRVYLHITRASAHGHSKSFGKSPKMSRQRHTHITHVHCCRLSPTLLALTCRISWPIYRGSCLAHLLYTTAHTYYYALSVLLLLAAAEAEAKT